MIKRHLSPFVPDLSMRHPVISVTSPRQSGRDGNSMSFPLPPAEH